MRLAGIDVGLLAIEELALRLEAAGNPGLSAGLRQAVAEGQVALALTAEQRRSILEALQNCPAGLLRLRDELRAQPPERPLPDLDRGLILGPIAPGRGSQFDPQILRVVLDYFTRVAFGAISGAGWH